MIATVYQFRVTDLSSRLTRYIELPEYRAVQITEFICIEYDSFILVLDFNFHWMYWLQREDKMIIDVRYVENDVVVVFDENFNIWYSRTSTTPQCRNSSAV